MRDTTGQLFEQRAEASYGQSGTGLPVLLR